jgi:hypothetical protein
LIYDIEGGLVDGAASIYLFELSLLNIDALAVIYWKINVRFCVVGAEMLHRLPMSVHVKIRMSAEVVVLRFFVPHRN